MDGWALPYLLLREERCQKLCPKAWGCLSPIWYYIHRPWSLIKFISYSGLVPQCWQLEFSKSQGDFEWAPNLEQEKDLSNRHCLPPAFKPRAITLHTSRMWMGSHCMLPGDKWGLPALDQVVVSPTLCPILGRNSFILYLSLFPNGSSASHQVDSVVVFPYQCLKHVQILG